MFKLLDEDKIDGHFSYVLEQIPKNRDIVKELGYSKIVTWIDKEIFIPRKAHL